MCDKKDCPKAYHLLCLSLTKPPYGRWECPWHDCSVCGSPASSVCDFCPRSFCPEHEVGSLTVSSLDERLCCSNHNPLDPLSTAPSTQPYTLPTSQAKVKEEPETDLGQHNSKWHFLIPHVMCAPAGYNRPFFQSLWRTGLLFNLVVAAGISKQLVCTVVRVERLNCWRGTRPGIILRCIPPPLLWSTPQLTSAHWRAQNATRLHLFYSFYSGGNQVVNSKWRDWSICYISWYRSRKACLSVSNMTNYHS